MPHVRPAHASCELVGDTASHTMVDPRCHHGPWDATARAHAICISHEASAHVIYRVRTTHSTANTARDASKHSLVTARLARCAHYVRDNPYMSCTSYTVVQLPAVRRQRPQTDHRRERLSQLTPVFRKVDLLRTRNLLTGTHSL